MIADSHCHAWRHWPYSTAVPDPRSRGDIGALLWEMDVNDIAFAAVVCARIGGGRDGEGYPNSDNNEYVCAAVADHPGRLTAWVDVDSMWSDEYHTPGAPERLQRSLDREGVTGFALYLRAGNDGWLRTEEADRFFAVAARAGVIASISCGAEWLHDLAALANRHPSLPVLLHHLGQPMKGAGAVEAIATVPNVGLKVSGFSYFVDEPWEYPYARLFPMLRRLCDAFGAERLYWGSDFPASRGALTYRQSIEVVRTHASFLSPTEKDAVLGGNLLELLAGRRA
jgi:predicted TIM-barrel fold metal-dependent hydrolase